MPVPNSLIHTVYILSTVECLIQPVGTWCLMTSGGAWPRMTTMDLIHQFPDGQICIEDSGKIVGAALIQRVR
jgi:hypothetical protein